MKNIGLMLLGFGLMAAGLALVEFTEFRWTIAPAAVLLVGGGAVLNEGWIRFRRPPGR